MAARTQTAHERFLLIPSDDFRSDHSKRQGYAIPRDPAGVSAVAHEQSLGLRALVQLLRDHLRSIVALTMLGAIIGFGLGSVLPRSYRADGLLIVDTQEINIPDFQTIRAQGTVEPWGARSAARVLMSREIVERAARNLDLEHDPDFNATFGVGSIRTALLNWLGRYVSPSAARLIGQSPPNQSKAWVDLVDALRHNLIADSEERSYAITLGFNGRDPDTTARVVNAVMDEFVRRELDAKRHAVAEAGAQLQLESQALGAVLDKTWGKIRSLEGRSGAVMTLNGTLPAQRLVALAQEQQKVDNDRARVSADFEQIRATRREGRTNLLNPDLETPRLKALLSADASLRQMRTDNAVRAGSDYPQMEAIRDQLARIAIEIAGEMDGIRDSLQQRLSFLDRQREILAAEVTETTQAAAASAADRAELEQLRADAQREQQLYQTYQTRYHQTLANLQVIQPSVRVVSRAVPPSHASSPGRGTLTVVSAAAGTLLAITVILGRRLLGGRVETLSEISDATGVPALGGIPESRDGFRFGVAVSDGALRRPPGLIIETVRGILLRLRCIDGPAPKIIMIASPQAGDGKTGLSLSMARIAARDGLRTLCIDADFRRPTLVNRAGLAPPGVLNDVLEGSVALEHAVATDRTTGAHVLAARAVADGDPIRLLEPTGLERLFDIARIRYDIVIVDTPPVLRVVDPLLIAPLTDAVVLVVPQGGVTREMVIETVQRLLRVRARIAGAVMARVGGRVPEEYVYTGYLQ